MQIIAPVRLQLSSGTIEALKWLAVVLMTLDHINKFLFDEALPAVSETARIVMPLFGFILAYNLARPGALQSGVYRRVIKRLAVFGLLASPMFVALVGWQPLNIMFTLLLAVVMMYSIEKGGKLRVLMAAVLFLVGGVFVEFSWYGVIFCVAAWFYSRQPSWSALLVWIVATAALYLVNRNLWALAALPVIFVAPYIHLEVPRWRSIFYVYYPAHLAVLWVVSRMI